MAGGRWVVCDGRTDLLHFAHSLLLALRLLVPALDSPFRLQPSFFSGALRLGFYLVLI